MSLDLDQELEACLEELRALRQPTAEALANWDYMKEWHKVVKARLIERYLERNPKWSHARADTAATADPEYTDALLARQQAQELALQFKWQMSEVETRLELWRTQEATKRIEMRAYS